MSQANSPVPVLDPAAIRITRLFPTPVASIVHPDHQRLNAELSAVILDHAGKTPGVTRSNEGGWQSTDDFAAWSGSAGAELIAFAKAFANQISAISVPGTGLVEADLDWTLNAWANVNQPGHSNALHGHPGSYWSGVYWVDDGGSAGVDDLGGELEFSDPRGLMPSLLSPSLRMRVEGCLTAGFGDRMTPSTGTFIMFPSWLQHAVTRYRGDRKRISVAINLIP